MSWLFPAIAVPIGLQILSSSTGQGWSQSSHLFLFGLHLLFLGRIAIDAAYAFSEDRQSGMLESILGTSVSVSEIVEGLAAGLRRRYLAPMLLILGVDGLVAFKWLFSDRPAGAIVLGAGMLAFLINGYSVIWTSLWQSMTLRHPSMAALSALGKILALPWMASGFLAGLFWRSGLAELVLLGLVLSAGMNWLFYFGAKNGLIEHFRTLALRPYGAKAPHIESSWSAINWEMALEEEGAPPDR